MQDKMRFNVSLFFLLCFVLVFGHALQGSFVYDDPRWIEHNRFIRDWANVKHFFSSQYFLGSQEMSYRPVTTISYMLDFSLFGLKPFGYRLHNLLLHWMVCALLWRVLADMTQSRIAAWWATFLFCFHPINVEAVVVPSLREEMQCAIFVLISWRWLWRPGRWVLGTIAFAVALLAKETALFFPILVVMALLLERRELNTTIFPLKGNPDHRVGTLGVLAAITAVYGCVRFLFMRSDLENTLPYVGGTIWTSVLTHATGWTRGLLKTVVPINLSVDPWMPVQYHWNSVPVLLAVLMGLLIAWLFLRSLRQNRLVAFGLSWFLIALLPTSGVIPIVNIYADRYFYMPLLGLAMALGGWLSKCELSTYRRWRPFLVLAVGLMALLTTGRVRVFADDPTLWGDALAKLGKRPWPLSAMVAQGDPPLIFLQKKLASDPNNTMPWTRLAAAHMVREEFEDAAEGLLKAIAIDPVNAEFHVMLADTYTQMERFDQAVEHYQRAIALKPQLAEAHNNLGVLFLEQGKREEAKEQFLRALLPQPDFPDAMSNLATVYGLEGDTAKAQQLWEAVLQLDAYHASARWNLQRLRNKRSR